MTTGKNAPLGPVKRIVAFRLTRAEMSSSAVACHLVPKSFAGCRVHPDGCLPAGLAFSQPTLAFSAGTVMAILFTYH